MEDGHVRKCGQHRSRASHRHWRVADLLCVSARISKHGMELDRLDRSDAHPHRNLRDLPSLQRDRIFDSILVPGLAHSDYTSTAGPHLLHVAYNGRIDSQ
jgi:hypothetical protein